MPEWLVKILNQTYIDYGTLLFRLLLTLVLSGIIGLERESKQQPAGLRTHILISVGAAMLMMLSIYIPQTFHGDEQGDPGRIAAQVVSGIGFLGAGAIFRLGTNVKGLTTAASIWVVASIGLLIGAGMYGGALIGTTIVLFSLVVLEKIENFFYPDYLLKALQLEFISDTIALDHIRRILILHGIKVQSTNMVQCVAERKLKIKLYIHLPKRIDLSDLYQDLNELENIHEIVLDEKL